MRRRIIRFLAAVCISAVWAGCTREDIIPSEIEETPKEEPSDTLVTPPVNPPEEPADTVKVRDDSDPVELRNRIGKMPTVRITVNKSDYYRLINWDKDTYIDGTIRFEDPDKWYSDTTLLESPFQMKGRGQSSWWNEKKPFKLKLDENHHSKVFGMPANRDWVLIANYNDKSLLRNVLGYKVSRIVGLTWTPRVRSCDLYINGSYEGNYLVVQHKEVAGKKVNINPVTPEDVDEEAVQGDYYIEVETNDCDYRTPTLRIPIIFKDPKLSEMVSVQKSYIKGYLKTWVTAVSKDEFDKVYELMDIDSFAKFWIIEELAKNIDGNFRKSTFMTKERGKKLILYHIWDFDIAFGNCDYMHTEFRPDSNGIYGDDPEGWFVMTVDEQCKSNGLYQHLFRDSTFVATCKAHWEAVYPELCALPGWLEAEAAVNRDSYDRNFQRWPVLGVQLWPNPWPVPADYDGELAALKSFLTRRLEWMNGEISSW